MGMSQTKLHHRVLQENWPAILRRLQTEDGKKWIKTKNPCGDYPLHLACYGGHAPPIIISALIAGYPEALYIENDIGYRPIELARSNYREGHPYRQEVLEYLEAYTTATENGNDDNVDTNEDNANESNEPLIISITDDGANLPDITFITSTTCVVCLERQADHVVVPCGHVCLCGDCAKKVVQKSGKSTEKYCPVGRCEMTAIAKVPNGFQPLTETPNQCIAVT